MGSTNFVSFLTVQGFFIGFVFSILKAQSAEGILIYTLLITTFFYLFSHFIISFFIRFSPARQTFFPKKQHEGDFDYYANEIVKREKIIDSTYDFLENLEKKYTKKEKKKSKAS